MRINTGFTQSNGALARVVDMSIDEYNACVRCVATAPSGVYQVFSNQERLMFRAFYDPDIAHAADKRADGKKRTKLHNNKIVLVADDQLQTYVNLATPTRSGNAITNMSDLNMPVYVSDQLCSTALYAVRSRVGSTSLLLQHNRAVYVKERQAAARCITRWLSEFAQHPPEENWYRACLGVGQWQRYGDETCVLQMDLLLALDTAWPIATMLATKMLKDCIPHNKLQYEFFVYPRCWLAPHYNGRSAVCVAASLDDCIATAITLYLGKVVTTALADERSEGVPQMRRINSMPVKRPPCLQLANPRYYTLTQGLKHQRRRQMALVAKAVYQATGQTLFTSAYFNGLVARGYKRESVNSLVANVASDLVAQKQILPASCENIRRSSVNGLQCPFASTDCCIAHLKLPKLSKQKIMVTPAVIAVGWQSY